MSSYKSVALPYTGYNPGGPTDAKHLEFPFDWLCTADATTATDWYVPFYITLDQAMEWWMRFRRLSAAFSLSDGSFTFNYTPTLNRLWTPELASVADEDDLNYPGILSTDTYLSPTRSPSIFSAALNDDGWNGPGSTLALTLQLDTFRKQTRTVNGSPVDIPHMIWQTDGALLMPSLVLTGSLVVTTPGTELSWLFTSEPLTGPAYTDTVSIFPAHGGAAIDLAFSSATVTPVSFSLSVDCGGITDSFWGWDRWNTTTGARL